MLPRSRNRFSERVRVVVPSSGSGRTKQSFAAECDINAIMRRYKVSGVLPVRPGATYGDFASVGDYQEAQLRLLQAERDFRQLPAAVRKRFGHDVTALLAFLGDPKNRQEAEELGLLERKLERNPGVVVRDLEPAPPAPKGTPPA